MAIDKKQRLINSWVKNDNIDLIDMYNKCVENELADFIYTQESLREVMAKHITDGDSPCWKTLKDIDENTAAELFCFDWSCWGMGATAIYTKEELANQLGY